ncbi:MAG: hypothetical protein ABI573_00260, partial [Chloroflexota bacterium]
GRSMKPDGIEAPVTSVLGAPRRSKDRARIAAVAVVAVAVLAAGIGLAGHGFTIDPSSSASPAPSGSAVVPASDAPAPTPELSFAPPTISPVLACAPVRLGKPPEIRLTSNPGNMVIVGVAAPSQTPADSSQVPTWPVLPVGGALRALSSSLDLAAQDNGCLRYVVAEYAPAVPGSTNGTVSFPIQFRTLNVSPPQSIVTLGPLPAGDWTLRIVAYFSTGQAGQEDGSVIERFFRVITSETTQPIPTPVTPPAVACAPLPRDGGPPTLTLTGSIKGPIPGATGTVATPLVPVRLGDQIEVRVAGDACAIEWSLTATREGETSIFTIDSASNPTLDPFRFSQNRWLLQNLPTGHLTLEAALRFSPDVSTTARWQIDVQGGVVPIVQLTAPDGTSVAGARPPCGTNWTSIGATSGFEFCNDDPLPATIPHLSAGGETFVRMELPGWTILGWGGSCGRVDPANQPSPYLVVNGCDLGGWSSGDGAIAPAPVMFLTRAGISIYRLYVSALRGTENVSMTVYVEIAPG